MILKRQIFTILILIVAGVANAQSDTTLSLSLKEAQELALTNNFEKKNAVLDVEAAKRKVWETTAIGLPQINGKIDYQYNPDVPKTSFPVPVLNTENLPDGTVNGTDLKNPDLFGLGMEAGPEFELGTKQNLTYGVTISQLIFSGEYIVGLQASKTYQQLSLNNLEKKDSDIKESIASSYYTVLVLERNLTILDSTIDNLNQTVKEVSAMEDQGLMETIDVDQLKLNLNNLENTRNSVQNQVKTSYTLLKIQLGINANSSVELSQSLSDLLLQANIENLSNELDFNIENNIDYKSMKTVEQISALSMKREKSTNLPSISGFYQYQAQAQEADFNFFMPHLFGINVTIPLVASGMRHSKIQQAKIELEKSRNNTMLLSRNLQMQAEMYHNQLQIAKANYQNSEKSLEISKKIYDQINTKYKLGMASSLDLTQSHDQYLNSYSNYTNAILEFLNAKTQLNKIQNKL